VAGRPERPIDPEAGPVQAFAVALRQLRQQDGGCSYRQLAHRAHYSPAALCQAAAGRTMPSLQLALAYVAACGGDAADWRGRWEHAREQLGDSPIPPGAGELDSPDPYREETYRAPWAERPPLVTEPHEGSAIAVLAGPPESGDRSPQVRQVHGWLLVGAAVAGAMAVGRLVTGRDSR